MDRYISLRDQTFSAFLIRLTQFLWFFMLVSVSVSCASPSLSRITCNSSAYNSSATDTCTVYLSSKVNSRTAVNLASNNPAVIVPSSVSIRSGASSAKFNASILAVSNAQSATITASGGGVSSAFNLALAPSTAGVLQSLTCADYVFTGPQAGTNPCTITLISAPLSAETIHLSSNTAQVSVPASVTIAAGQTSASFTAVMNPITIAQTATLMAAANGASVSFNIQLQVGSSTLSIGPSALSFGNVAVGTAVTKSVTLTSVGSEPVTVNSAAVSGTGFALQGASFPFTLNAGQSVVGTIQFSPSSSGAVNGLLTVSSSAPTVSVSLSGTGTVSAPTVSGLTCSNVSITGALADACSVTLSGTAPTGGLTVNLASNSSAVTLPASITVPATASTATFTANASCVSTAQAATITAASGTSSQFVSLQLNAASAATSLNSTSIAFGDVPVNTPAAQSITISSTGSAPLTVNSATVSGTGFSITGVSLPTTLNPGQQLTLSVEFYPAAAGSFSGQVTIATNAGSPSATLSGIGEPHEVELSWQPPSPSTDPVVGYNIYRAPSGTSAYQLLNGTVQSPTTYTDNAVQSGSSYDYVVRSVDAFGTESAASNTASVAIP